MAERIDDLEAYVEELDAKVDEIDHDLGEVEEELYDDCDCDDDEEFFEIICPSCGETVCFDESVDPEELTCPACGEKFECIVEEDDLKALDGVEGSDEE